MKQRKYWAGGWRLGAGALCASAYLVAPVHAQEANCVQLKTDGQKEERYTDAQGKPATRLVSLGKVLPGDDVVWVITASNRCAKPAEKVVVANNVPEHMSYIDGSAQGPADITYSINTRDFAKQSDLTVGEANGTSRRARADEIKAIRWVLSAPLPTGGSASVRYRAKVN